jgi:hypothetical protein
VVLQLLAQKTGVDLNLGELKQLVGREISSCLQPSRQHHLSNAEQQQPGKLSSSTEQLSKPSSAGAEQLPKLSSDVTLTKVAAPERLSEKDKETKVRGASKIKVKKVNKKRTVTVRRLIIFLNISRRPLLICLQCCLHQYKTLKAVATAKAAIVLLSPAKNLKKVF